MLISRKGGVDVEDDKVVREPIEISDGLPDFKARELAKRAGFDGPQVVHVSKLLKKMYACFVDYDLKLMEVNPFVIIDKKVIALDAALVVDESALSRQSFPYSPRIGSRELNDVEKQARKIDDQDYRGTAGKTYVDMDGDIAVLASGGGASLAAMDALISYGGKPANYAEYSGNPPPEKITKLTKIALSKPGLSGCWVVGGFANFTRIDITMQGLVDGLKELDISYPIVVRRAGPGDKEGFEILRRAAKEHDLDIHIFDEKTPITASAKRMVELSEQYKKSMEVKKG